MANNFCVLRRDILPITLGRSCILLCISPPELRENLLNNPWPFGFLLAGILALSLELGRRVGVSTQVLQHSERKEQMVAIRDGLFVLVSLLLGFTLTLAAARFVERRSLL